MYLLQVQYIRRGRRPRFLLSSYFGKSNYSVASIFRDIHSLSNGAILSRKYLKQINVYGTGCGGERWWRYHGTANRPTRRHKELLLVTINPTYEAGHIENSQTQIMKCDQGDLLDWELEGKGRNVRSRNQPSWDYEYDKERESFRKIIRPTAGLQFSSFRACIALTTTVKNHLLKATVGQHLINGNDPR